MKYGLVAVIIAVLLLVAGGAWWLTMGNDETQTERSANETAESQLSDSEATAQDEETETSIVITYTDSGFRLSGNTIQAGETVRVVNESSEALQFASDPHPQHTDNDDLNIPTLAPGEEETFVVNETGAWGFHNHLNDDHSGSITVTN